MANEDLFMNDDQTENPFNSSNATMIDNSDPEFNKLKSEVLH